MNHTTCQMNADSTEMEKTACDLENLKGYWLLHCWGHKSHSSWKVWIHNVPGMHYRTGEKTETVKKKKKKSLQWDILYGLDTEFLQANVNKHRVNKLKSL